MHACQQDCMQQQRERQNNLKNKRGINENEWGRKKKNRRSSHQKEENSKKQQKNSETNSKKNMKKIVENKRVDSSKKIKKSNTLQFIFIDSFHNDAPWGAVD